MRSMSVVAVALVAIVAISGNASAQGNTTVNTATVLAGTDGGGPIVSVILSRTPGKAGYWYIDVQGPVSVQRAMPRCMIRSTDRALIFAFHQIIVENLRRAMVLNCSQGATLGGAHQVMDLDTGPSQMTVQ
jgi:hypothetical protein